MYKNKIRCTLSTIFLTALLAVATVHAADAADPVIILKIDNPNMLVNGTVREIDPGKGTTPVLSNSSTLVPIRAIIESLGGTVRWEESEEKVAVALNEKVVELWLDKNTAKVNGTEMPIEAPPTTMNGRTMLPLRFVSESLGLCVNWEEGTQSISISASGDYVAVVAGEIVTGPEFNIFLSRAKQEIMGYIVQNQPGESTMGSLWDTKIDGIEVREIAKETALYYAKEFKTYLAKSKENDTALNPDEIKNIDNYMDQMMIQQGGKDGLEKKVKEVYNITLEEYRIFYKDSMLIDKYMTEVYREIQISEDEIKDYYESNKDSIDEVTVKHILLSTVDQGSPLPAEKQEEAKKKADEILAKVKSGEDFAALAKQYSQDPGSKDSGGEYTFGRGEMVKEFEDWSFTAKPGDVGIVKSFYGYHVMKFEMRTTFDDVKAAIRDALANETLTWSVQEWMADPRYVVIKNQGEYNKIQIMD